MSNALINAFNSMSRLNAREITYSRAGGTSTLIMVCPANYHRKLESFEEVTIKGREYIIPMTELSKTTYTSPKKGDRITDTELGTKVVGEINEIIILGKIAGFRIRTE